METDAIPSVFEDPIRRTEDVQNGGSVVTDYIPMVCYEPCLRKFQDAAVASIKKLKADTGRMLCSRYREQKSEDSLPIGQYLGLLRHEFGLVIYPYERSPDDASFIGFDGTIIRYGSMSYITRRIITLVGKAIWKANSFVNRITAILKKRARERHFDGQSVAALPVGGFAEALFCYENIPQDMEWFFDSLLQYDRLFVYKRHEWRLELPIAVHLENDDYHTSPERYLVPVDDGGWLNHKALSPYGEWNECLGRYDALSSRQQRNVVVVRQARPLCDGFDSNFCDFVEQFRDSEYIDCRTGGTLQKSETLRHLLVWLASSLEELILATKHRVASVVNARLPEGVSLVSPEHLVFPNEHYLQSPHVNCTPLYDGDFVPEQRALALLGSAFCCYRDCLLHMGLAYNKMKSLNKTYRRGVGEIPGLVRGVFLVERFERKLDDHFVFHRAKDVGPKLMHHTQFNLRNMDLDERLELVFPPLFASLNRTPRLLPAEYPPRQLPADYPVLG